MVLIGVALALLLNVAGAADAAIRRVTSRNLGSLAPGYAASPGGLRVYAVLLLALGVAFAGVGIAAGRPVLGFAVLVAGLAVFAIASVIAIAGEVRTYRRLKR